MPDRKTEIVEQILAAIGGLHPRLSRAGTGERLHLDGQPYLCIHKALESGLVNLQLWPSALPAGTALPSNARPVAPPDPRRPETHYKSFEMDAQTAVTFSAGQIHRVLGLGVKDEEWTKEENASCIAAYFWMLDEELAHHPIVKSHVVKELMAGQMRARSRPSIEYKFANISFVLHSEGLPYVDGYKPRSNAQADLRKAVLTEVARRGLRGAGTAPTPVVATPVATPFNPPPQTAVVAPAANSGTQERQPRTVSRPATGGQGYEADPRVKKVVELHAMGLALAHYRKFDPQVEDTSTGNPFDLRCRIGGIEVRVEVKGTRGDGSSVILTDGEVRNAHGAGWRTDLFVVAGIEVLHGEPPMARGGTTRIIEGWKPDAAALFPTEYRYTPPAATALRRLLP